MKRTLLRRRAAVLFSSLTFIGVASVASVPSLGCSGDLRDLWSCDALAHAECSKWKDCGTITDEDACYESVRHTLESTLGKANYNSSSSGDYQPGDARGKCLDKVDDSSKCLDDLDALACSTTGPQAVASCDDLSFNTAVAPAGLGSSSGNGTTGGAFKVCAPTNETCTNAELATYQQCVIASCASLYTTCLGSNFRTGSFSGPCADYYACTQKCDCNDTSCTSKCTSSSACSTCLIENSSSCGSSCTAPTCTGGGSTTKGLGAGFVGQWTGSITNRICQNESTSPQCFSGTVQFELDLSQNGTTELQAVMPTSYSQDSPSGNNGCSSIPIEVASDSVANGSGQTCNDQGTQITFTQFSLTLQSPNALVIDIASTQTNNGGITTEYTGTLSPSTGSH